MVKFYTEKKRYLFQYSTPKSYFRYFFALLEKKLLARTNASVAQKSANNFTSNHEKLNGFFLMLSQVIFKELWGSSVESSIK